LEQRVEQLGADISKLANKNGENFRLQYAAAGLAAVEDALEDVAEDQQSYDSRSIDISFYQMMPVVRVLVECFAAYSLLQAIMPFFSPFHPYGFRFAIARLVTILQLLFTILAFVHPYVACLLPVIGSTLAALLIWPPSLTSFLDDYVGKPMIGIIAIHDIIASHAITVRLFLDLFGCGVALKTTIGALRVIYGDHVWANKIAATRAVLDAGEWVDGIGWVE
jgi:hypothetical protein